MSCARGYKKVLKIVDTSVVLCENTASYDAVCGFLVQTNLKIRAWRSSAFAKYLVCFATADSTRRSSNAKVLERRRVIFNPVMILI